MPATQYNFGFVSVPGGFETIMSYRDECRAAGASCIRINNFSNPALNYGGRPTGIPAGSPGAADAARWLNEVRAIVANYRPTGGGVTTPPNNLFANRITIAGPGTVTGSNVGATAEPGQPLIVYPTSTNAVWWRFTPSQAGILTIDTCGSNFDTLMAVFTGPAVNALSGVASNDDSCGLQSRVTFAATANVEHQIAVVGYQNDTGSITLNLAFSPTTSATVTALSAPTSGAVGEVLAFGAAVAPADPAVIGTPGGTVSFRRNGTEFATGTLNAAGIVFVSSGSLPVGTHQITAHYLGDASFAASASAARSLTISATSAATTTSLDAPPTGTVGQSLTFSATVTSPGGTPGGTVAFRLDGNQFATGSLDAAGTARVSNSSIPEGTHQITAQYLGNASFAASASAARTLTILAAPGRELQIATGQNHTCALSDDQLLYCWGSNGDGQLGTGTTTDQLTPTLVSRMRDAARIATGLSHTCALRDNGMVSCWGANESGQLGDGSTRARRIPGRVSGLSRITQIATGQNHACALSVFGTVLCWGANNMGQLGDGSTTDRSRYVRVVGLRRVTAIAAGGNHTCALRDTGAVVCWGGNNAGQLGDGTTIDRLAPVWVAGMRQMTQITAGLDHTCALRNDGSAFCWGANRHGQLGDGTITNRPRRIRPPGLGQVVQISAGSAHTCALRATGTVSCWGANNAGQLGDRTTVERLRPVSVLSLGQSLQVSAGGEHSCALQASGGVFCWGLNASGQLGDGTRRSSTSPVGVSLGAP